MAKKFEEHDDFAKLVVRHSISGIADMVAISACVWFFYQIASLSQIRVDSPEHSIALDFFVAAAIVVVAEGIKYTTISKLSAKD